MKGRELMNFNLALVTTELVDGAPVPGIPVTFTSYGGAGLVKPGSAVSEAITDASGAATVVLATSLPDPGPPSGFTILPPQPPSTAGDFTTWNIALVLTSASDGSPVPGCGVFLGPAAVGTEAATDTDQSGAATVSYKIFASVPQVLPMQYPVG
jgi:hypothetical protein